MTTTINASNSGSGGLIQTADASGVLALQTAGTTAVTINASQNVGIGTTSPSYRVDAVGAGSPANGIMRTSSNLTNATTKYGYYTVGHYTNATVPFGFIQGESNSTENNVHIGGGAGEITAATRIDFYTAANNSTTNGTERMRIDSSGNVLVGTTSSLNSNAAVLTALGAQQNQMVYFRNSNATNPAGIIVNYSGATPNNTGSEFFFGNDPSQTRFALRSNGGLANYSANNSNISDRREKTNFAPAKPYLDVICAIPVQTFNYIDQNLEEDPGLTLGVVAQDVQAVAPELVMESDWSSEKDGSKVRLSIYQTDLQYALMKCIQEQQALITSLTARIAALEGTPA